MIDAGSTDFQQGADVDIQFPGVQCCPALRLANPASAPSEVMAEVSEPQMQAEAIEQVAESETGDDSLESRMYDDMDEFRIAAVPNPADETLGLFVHVPEGGTASVSLWTSNGTKVMDMAGTVPFHSGDHQLEIVTRQLPAGLYFLRGQSGQENLLVKLMVIH